MARVVEGVKVGPSPDWLVERLESLGMRSINNIVDISNFVLWELGQPTHAFDLDKLSEKRIVVRRGLGGETLVTLDGERRELDPEMLVIADSEAVMGTLSRSGVDGLLIGNTAERILRRLECSVLAVKPEGFRTPLRFEEAMVAAG